MMVSVIIPVYNAENYIRRCIESVLNQTYTDIEIIVVDDGSTDNTFSVVRGFVSCERKIIALSQEHSGPASARNSGIRYSSGEYILFADADDYMEPHMVEVLVGLLSTGNNDIATCGYYKDTLIRSIKINGFDRQKYTGDVAVYEYIKFAYTNQLLNAVWNKMYSRRVIKHMFDENLIIGEDIDFNIKNLMRCNSIVATNDCLYHYNAGNIESISSTYDTNVLVHLWNTDKKLEIYIKERFGESVDMLFLKEHSIKKTFVYLILSCNKKVHKNLYPTMLLDDDINKKLCDAFKFVTKPNLKMLIYKFITKSKFVGGLYVLSYLRELFRRD